MLLYILDFMKELIEEIKTKNDKNNIIILDNCTAHKTEELIKFYNEEKLNFLFNVQYCSYLTV